jgi:hypothetical protein
MPSGAGSSSTCTFCGKPGHRIEKCFTRINLEAPARVAAVGVVADPVAIVAAVGASSTERGLRFARFLNDRKASSAVPQGYLCHNCGSPSHLKHDCPTLPPRPHPAGGTPLDAHGKGRARVARVGACTGTAANPELIGRRLIVPCMVEIPTAHSVTEFATFSLFVDEGSDIFLTTVKDLCSTFGKTPAQIRLLLSTPSTVISCVEGFDCNPTPIVGTLKLNCKITYRRLERHAISQATVVEGTQSFETAATSAVSLTVHSFPEQSPVLTPRFHLSHC